MKRLLVSLLLVWIAVVQVGSQALITAPNIPQDANFLPNDATAGTIQGSWITLSSAGNAVVLATTAIYGTLGLCIAQCGTTGQAVYITRGVWPVNLDNAGVAGHWVVPSTTTAGSGHDTGLLTRPTQNLILGLVQGAAPGGKYYVTLEPPDMVAGGSGTGGLSSVGLSMPSYYTVANSPLTANGTLNVTASAGQTSHQVLGTCGTATTVSLCSLQAADIPAVETAPPTLAYLPWMGYGSSVSAGGAVVLAANGGRTQSFFLQFPITMANITFRVGVGSGTGCTGGQCGLLFGMYDSSGATQFCTSNVATSGGAVDINSVGVKVLPMVCTLSPGFYLLAVTTDSAALQLTNFQDAGATMGALISGINNRYWGQASAMSIGNGSALTFTNLSALSFVGSTITFQIGLAR